MRLFIAINLDDNIRDTLAEMQESMRRQGVRGNYTKIENLHLTLAFIGEYGDLDALNDALASVPLEPFRLALRGYGSFGNLYWAGLTVSQRDGNGIKVILRHFSCVGFCAILLSIANARSSHGKEQEQTLHPFKRR